MPGENLHKLNKGELNQLRDIVRKVYAREEGATLEDVKHFWTNRECDKLIDSLLPSTVETLKEMGEARGFLAKKKFFLPSKILNMNGKNIIREDVD
jgi:hypothetical protein